MVRLVSAIRDHEDETRLPLALFSAIELGGGDSLNAAGYLAPVHDHQQLIVRECDDR